MTDARTLTAALGGKWRAGHGMACCPAHDDCNPSLSIRDGNNGSPIFHCFAGCDYREVKDALRERGLVEGRGGTYRPDPAREARRRQEEDAHNVMRSRRALDVWDQGQLITGTPAERYVRGRGITCALPDTLRYIRECRHMDGQRFPAMVAYVKGGDHPAVHRTYLDASGEGKAAVASPKLMLGPTAGGAVHLSAEPGPLVVTEGIETGLSLLSGLFPCPASIWAALSAPGMKALRLPPTPGELVIAPDGDPVGRAAAAALASRADALGWRVSLFRPPEGHDWNDVLTGKALKA